MESKKPPLRLIMGGTTENSSPDSKSIIYFTLNKDSSKQKLKEEQTATEFRLLGVIEDILLEIQILQKRQDATYLLLEKLFIKK